MGLFVRWDEMIRDPPARISARRFMFRPWQLGNNALVQIENAQDVTMSQRAALVA